MKKKGFTIVELLIVISIIGILTSIGIYNVVENLKKRNIEDDVNKIYSIIEKYRTLAFLEKKSFICKFDLTKKNFLIYDSNNNLIDKVNLKDKFYFKTGNSLIINTRGLLSGSSIKPVENLSSTPEYDCVAVDNTGIKLGSWDKNNEKCVFE